MKTIFIAIGASIIAVGVAMITGNSRADIETGLKIILIQLTLMTLYFLIDEARNAAR